VKPKKAKIAIKGNIDKRLKVTKANQKSENNLKSNSKISEKRM